MSNNKQETLEAAAERFLNEGARELKTAKQVLIAFAKEQQEKMYSGQEVKNLIEDWTKMKDGLNLNFPRETFTKWFEQFKK